MKYTKGAIDFSIVIPSSIFQINFLQNPIGRSVIEQKLRHSVYIREDSVR